MVLLEEISDTGATGLLPTTAKAARSVSNTSPACREPKAQSQIVHSAGAGVEVKAKGDHQVSKEQPSQPLTTFTCFSKLPAELRIIIWKLTFCKSRIIQVDWKLLRNGNESPDFVRVLRWKTRVSQPVALIICKESRTEALKSYKLISCRQLWTDLPHSSPKRFKRFYFDPAKDILELSYDAMETMRLIRSNMDDKNISLIRLVRLDGGRVVSKGFSGGRGTDARQAYIKHLLCFTRLEEVVLELFDMRSDLSEDCLERNTECFTKELNEGFRKQRAGDEAFKGVGDVKVIFVWPLEGYILPDDYLDYLHYL